MRFDRLEVDNFKSIDYANVDFDSGIIVVYGPNGAGKSSFLEAAYFALYGSDAVPASSTLEDVMKKQTDTTTVELTFTHNGTTHTVKRELTRRASGSPKHNVKLEKEGDVIAEKVSGVEETVENLLRMQASDFVNCSYVRQGEIELVDADPDERREMIDRLLQLGDLDTYHERGNRVRLGVKNVRDEQENLLKQTRKEIEDLEDKDLDATLAQLKSELADLEAEKDRLDDEIEQAKQARDEAQDRIDDYEDKQQEIQDLEDRVTDLDDQIEEKTRERNDITDTITTKDQERSDAITEINEALADLDVDADSLTALEHDGDDVAPANRYDTTPIDTAAEGAAEQADALGDEINTKRMKVTELEGEAENLRTQAATKDDQADEKRGEIGELNAKIREREQKCSDLEDEIEDLDTEIGEYKARFDELGVEYGNAETARDDLQQEIDDLQNEIASVEGDWRTASEAVEKGEQLLDEGKCPECGQDIEDAPHVTDLDEKRAEADDLKGELDSLRETKQEKEARLDDLRELVDLERKIDDCKRKQDDLREKIEDHQSEIEAVREDIEAVTDDVDRLESEAADLRETAAEKEAEASTLEETIAELDAEQSDYEQKAAACERVSDQISDLMDTLRRLADARSRKQELDDMISRWESEKADAEDELTELRDEHNEDALEDAKQAKQDAVERLESLNAELDTTETDIKNVQAKIGGVERDLETLEAKREQANDLQTEVDRLNRALTEAEDVQTMYKDLQAELREQNVRHLEGLVNDIFFELYHSDTYDRIDLSGEYDITIHDKDGSELDPQMLSGGEQVMLNLALRCAIYKLLTEASSGEENAPGTLPPLILDEPTADLDDEHVGKLDDVTELMRELGVDQTVVVSHDREVISSADFRIEVSVKSTANSSRVEREGGALPDI